MLDRRKVIEAATSRLYTPYLLGAKWKLDNLNPPGPIDCSGFVRWCYWRGGLVIPDGSAAQFDASEITTLPIAGDLGFLQKDGHIYHVGIYNAANVIEARGEPANMVFLRPSAKWEASPNFAGWKRIKVV